jgi:hypothetical protein
MHDMSYAQFVGEVDYPTGHSYAMADLAEDMAAGDYDAADMRETLQLVAQNDAAEREAELRQRIATLESALAQYES